ncbi:hypothetical protein DL96DRAFT_1288757 [Flagelloscypha sp. PMI_526]|nr:hypothetical protein DL96DRAFT_1288757 [Flagelloscypha sp. PMI_526]
MAGLALSWDRGRILTTIVWSCVYRGSPPFLPSFLSFWNRDRYSASLYMASSMITGREDAESAVMYTQQQIQSVLNINVAVSRPFPADMLEDLLGFIARHQKLRAPIYHLPAEILLEIFSCYCFSWDGIEERYDNACPGPLSLSQVCRFWRSIAESNPTLWTIISFLLDGHPTYPFTLADAPSLLNKWVELSRDMLLSVFISGDAAFGYYDDHGREESVFQAVSNLMATSYRWEALDLGMDGTCPYWISTCTQLPN